MATKSDNRPAAKQSRVDRAKAQARQDRLRLLGQILRISRGEMTQEQVAELLSRIRGERVIQTSVSRWEKGMVDMSVEMIRDIEQALGLEKGSILLSAGYASTDATVPALIRSDTTIHPNFRGDLERIYKSYQEMSRQLFDAETANLRRRNKS